MSWKWAVVGSGARKNSGGLSGVGRSPPHAQPVKLKLGSPVQQAIMSAMMKYADSQGAVLVFEVLEMQVFVYERRSILYTVTYSSTVSGIAIPDGPPAIARQEDSPEAIGRQVVAALSRTRKDLPHPAVWEKQSESPVLQAAGVKTWKALARGGRAAGFYRSTTEIVVTPYMEQDGELVPMGDRRRAMLLSATAIDIGNAALAALQEPVESDE